MIKSISYLIQIVVVAAILLNAVLLKEELLHSLLLFGGPSYILFFVLKKTRTNKITTAIYHFTISFLNLCFTFTACYSILILINPPIDQDGHPVMPIAHFIISTILGLAIFILSLIAHKKQIILSKWGHLIYGAGIVAILLKIILPFAF